MRIVLLAVAVSLLALPASGFAQQANPVSTALRADEERYEKNLVGAAETMPAGKFGTKPTDKQMSFGELLLHVARSNDLLCSSISGQKAPETAQLLATSGKDALLAALKQSFAFCRAALAATDDSKLGEEVPFFGGRRITRAAAMLSLAADWGDHYSLAATELRVAGLLPPSAQRAANTSR